MADIRQDRDEGAGASCRPGSHEPSPKGLGPTGVDPSRKVWDGKSRTADGKVLPETKRIYQGRRWQILLMPRGRRREYARLLGKRIPLRFGYFRRNSYNTTLGIFLPALPWLGAWRLIISRHKAWLTRDSDTRHTAETGTGSVRSTGSAGLQASPDTPSHSGTTERNVR